MFWLCKTRTFQCMHRDAKLPNFLVPTTVRQAELHLDIRATGSVWGLLLTCTITANREGGRVRR